MGTGNWGPSKCGNLFPLFLLIIMSAIRELNIYIDESGDYSPYSKENPLFSVAFVMVVDDKSNNYALNVFRKHLSNNEGGDHFVHTGNLVRAEKPYIGMLREKRQDLFYSLFLLAKYAKYKVCCANVVKKNRYNKLTEYINDIIYKTVIEYSDYFSRFNRIVLHYDNGQCLLGGIILSAFRSLYKNVFFAKTMQQDSPFMQIADLYSYFELIKYKIILNNLSKSEIAFFGTARKIRKNYIEQLKSHFL